MSLNQITANFKSALVGKPYGLNMKEFNSIIEPLCGPLTNKDRALFKRFEYLMLHEDKDAKIICANIELVRFGVVSGRNDRVGNSGDRNPPSFAHVKDLNKLLDYSGIESVDIKRLPSSVLKYTESVDEWVRQSVSIRDELPIPKSDVLQEEENDGNHRVQTMKYISVYDMVECIANSRNASSLRQYAMRLMSAFRIYNIELNKVLANANASLEQKNDELTNKIEILIGNTNQLLGHVKNVETQNANLSDQIENLHDDLEDRTDVLTSAMTHLTNKSEVSTIKPTDPKKHQYVGIMVSHDMPFADNSIKVVTGQAGGHFGRRMKQLNLDGYEHLVEPFYIANGIDFRFNLYQYLTQHCKDVGTTLANVGVCHSRRSSYRFNNGMDFSIGIFIGIVCKLIADTKKNPMSGVRIPTFGDEDE